MGRNNRISEWSWLIEEMKAAKIGTDFRIPIPMFTPRDIRRKMVAHVRMLCRYHGLKVRFWRLGGVQLVRLEGRFQVVTSVPLQKRER